MSFKVAATSADEMQPMYQKLNYLMSNLMPDYSYYDSNNNNVLKEGIIMKGPFIKLTVGNWLDGQDGILNSLTYSIPNDAPWEIGLPADGVFNGTEPLVLPHVVEVSLTFTPIGSQTQGINRVSQKSDKISNIAQNYNGKSSGEANWIDPSGSIRVNPPLQRTKDIATPPPPKIPNLNSNVSSFGNYSIPLPKT